MQGMRWTLRLALLLGLMAAVWTAAPTQSFAADEDAYRETSDVSKMCTKLGRGIVNVLTGWVEIPKNIAKEWRESDPFTGFVLGTLKGIAWGVGRTFAGVYEVVSFPFPIPRDYKPIMQPEYILPSVWGESLPLFREDYKAASTYASEEGAPGSRYSSATGPTYGKDAALQTADKSGTAP